MTNHDIRNDTIKPRIIPDLGEPEWLADYMQQLHDDKSRLRYYRSLFPSNAYRVPTPRETIKSHMITVTDTTTFKRLRRCEPASSLLKGSDRYLTTYLGTKTFIDLPYRYPYWHNRTAYYLASDIVALNRKAGRASLCLNSACRFYNIPLFIDEPITHLVWDKPYRCGTRQASHRDTPFEPVTVKQHSYTLDSSDITYVDGVSVTTMLRTFIDILAYMPSPFYIVPADAILARLIPVDHKRRRYNKKHYADLKQAVQWRCDSFPGRFPSRKVMRRFEQLSPLSESPGESMLRLFFHSAGFPKPQVQYPLSYVMNHRQGVSIQRWPTAQSKTAFVDMAWPDRGLAVEFDGMGKYEDVDATRAEKQREAIVSMQFPHVLRFIYDVFSDWHQFQARLETVLQ